MADMVRASDHGATLDKELSDMPITSEVLAVAVREDDDVPRVRVLPERHRDLRLPTGEGLQLCAHRMLQSPLRTPAPGMAVIEHRYLGLHPPPALGVEKA